MRTHEVARQAPYEGGRASPIPTIAGSIRMGSPALLEPGTCSLRKRGAWLKPPGSDSEHTWP